MLGLRVRGSHSDLVGVDGLSRKDIYIYISMYVYPVLIGGVAVIVIALPVF